MPTLAKANLHEIFNEITSNFVACLCVFFCCGLVTIPKAYRGVQGYAYMCESDLQRLRVLIKIIFPPFDPVYTWVIELFGRDVLDDGFHV